MMETLADINKEASLLDLKYKHLIEVCESLLKPWNGRSVNGKIIRKDIKEKDGPPQTEAVSDVTKAVESTSKELADLQLLDNILFKAQSIRESNQKPKKTTTTSIAMATQIYGQPKPPSKKFPQKLKSSSSTLKSKQHFTSKMKSLESPPLVVNHKVTTTKSKAPAAHQPTAPFRGSARDDIGMKLPGHYKRNVERSNSSHLTGDEVGSTDELKENTIACFQLCTSGQRLSMPSRYAKLQQLLSRIDAQQEELARQPVDRGADHCSRRLLSKESTEEAVVIQLLLVLQEYALIKRELLAFTPKEWAVSDKSQWQDVLRVKSHLDSILERVQELRNYSSRLPEEESKKAKARGMEATPSDLCSMLPAIIASLPSLAPDTAHSSGRRLAYTEVRQLKELATLEQQLLFEMWEAKLVGFVERTVLPVVMTTKNQSHQTCELFRCIHTLFGSRESGLSYLLLE